MNCLYLAKPIYGGWVSFTSHLCLKYNYPLYKVAKRHESHSRHFGYGVDYRNVRAEDLAELGTDKLLITALDKHYYEHLPLFYGAFLVIHDPTELKDKRLVEQLEFFRIITIRKKVADYLEEKHGIKSVNLLHPFFPFKKTLEAPARSGAISISRIDYDKHTEIILEANKILQFEDKPIIEIYGKLNELYAYHKLRPYNFYSQYKGNFSKDFASLEKLLYNKKFVVDMSAIKGDGGGTQYSFLEAWYMGCILVISSKWIVMDCCSPKCSPDSGCLNGYNSIIVDNADELVEEMKCLTNSECEYYSKHANRVLNRHIEERDWELVNLEGQFSAL